MSKLGLVVLKYAWMMFGKQFTGNGSRRVSWVFVPLILAVCGYAGPAQFTRDFAALDGIVKPGEQPFRQELCLNGTWQFQPVTVPPGYLRDQGVPPELPLPSGSWESVLIKIPSPWNVNTWGTGRNVGTGTPHPYWPDSVCFPSYPAS
jgi:beta-galactosidase